MEFVCGCPMWFVCIHIFICYAWGCILLFAYVVYIVYMFVCGCPVVVPELCVCCLCVFYARLCAHGFILCVRMCAIVIISVVQNWYVLLCGVPVVAPMTVCCCVAPMCFAYLYIVLCTFLYKCVCSVSIYCVQYFICVCGCPVWLFLLCYLCCLCVAALGYSILQVFNMLYTIVYMCVPRLCVVDMCCCEVVLCGCSYDCICSFVLVVCGCRLRWMCS